MRAVLVLLGVVAVLGGGAAWVLTGMIAGSHDSSCQGEPIAEVAFAASTLAVVLALATIGAALGPWARAGWWMLGTVALLLSAVALLAGAC